VKLPALLLVGGMCAGVLRFGPNVPAGPARLHEQTHLVLYGVFGLLACWLLRRRFADGALYLFVLLLAFLVSLLDEGLQAWHPARVGALEDVRLNLMSTLCGVALAALVLLLGRPPLRVGREGLVPVLRLLAIDALVLAAFVDQVHLGHAHSPPGGAVVVRSRFTAPELQARNRSWHKRQEPKGIVDPLRRGPDFYREEASWHHRRRNQALQEQDVETARREQGVLDGLYPAYVRDVEEARLEALPPPQADALRAAASEPLAPATSGPEHLITGLDRTTLWLASLMLASAALFGAELVLVRRYASAL
jgi:VanZ family protein